MKTRSSKANKQLWEISVVTSEEHEDVATNWFETTFQQIPSVYIDVRTGRRTVTIYSPARPDKATCPAGKVSVRKLDPNWKESWKRHFKPMDIGNALLIKPSWSKRKPRKNQKVIVLDPGLSFGTGQHATTSFCLNEIVRLRNGQREQHFLDIGTGSGILAIAAAKMGYSPIFAIDYDPDAVRIARENAKRNRVEHKIRFEHEDLTQLKIRHFPRCDLICANLIYDMLCVEAKRICSWLKPGGKLVLAGILREQFPQVRDVYERFGLKLVRSKMHNEWHSGTMTD
ncbi:MAG: ribosomal methyltransferase [Verrucomicrobiales bacterium]|nr:ribosomal methyltransferase [Verrucomicrobiales bacterium]